MIPRIRIRSVIVALLVALLANAASGGAEAEAVVETDAGAVRGIEEHGTLAFKGIPYAAPPTGERRWRPPVAPRRWQGVREATRFAPDCPGTFPDHARMAEDCLYLNLWTGGPGKAAKRPVMVWIYGGGFRGGSAAAPEFDGADLARQGVVLVSFGYRTGPLGFLATPQLSSESPHGVSGNYGLLDAIAVLRWVRSNIAGFGGDPDNVTLFGQSSGSETINILTASPLAKGLFQRAIGESGSSFGVRRAQPLREAEKAGTAFMRDLGAADLPALRELPVDRLIARDADKFEPNVDGWLLPDDVYAIYEQGRQNDVPMLIGNTAQEFPRPPEITREQLAAGLTDDFGPLAGAIAADLSGDAPTDARWRLTNREWGDFPAATWSCLQAKTGRAPIYRYLFDYAPPAPQGEPRIARHGSELAYVFGTYRNSGNPQMGLVDDRTHALLSGYWVNFARTGNPNGPGLPKWPSVREAPGEYMRFGEAGATLVAVRDAALVSDLARHYYPATAGHEMCHASPQRYPR